VVEVLKGARGRDGLYRAEIQVRPPELGRIGLRIEVKDRRVEVQAVVESKVVHDVLASHLPELRMHLEQRGYQLTGCHVHLSGHGGGGGQGQGQGLARWAPSYLPREGEPAAASYRAVVSEDHVDVLA